MTMSNNYTAVSHASRDMMNPSSPIFTLCVLVLSPQTQGGGIFWVLGSQHEVGSSELFCAASYGEAMTWSGMGATTTLTTFLSLYHGNNGLTGRLCADV